MTQAYAHARAQAIEHLRQYALEGRVEALYLLDRDTGALLHFQEGERDTVPFEPTMLAGQANVGALHCHPDVAGPSDYDWQTFTQHEGLREMVVIDARFVYRVEKPSGWTLKARTGSDESIAWQIFQNFRQRIEASPKFRQTLWLSPDDAAAAAIWETNQRLARLYGVSLSKEAL